MNKRVGRYDIADFLLIKDTKKFAFMGTGFNTLNEDVGAQVEGKTYINNKNKSSAIKGYDTKFPYDLDLMYNDADDDEAAEIEAVQELYFIGRDHKVGTDAEREYVRTELFLPVTPGNTRYFKARKFKVAVEVTNSQGAGGETMTGAGNLNCVGDPVFGYFDIVDRKFTEGEYVAPTIGSLTVNSIAGTTTGTSKITVAETLGSGNKYVYKTGSTPLAFPTYDDVLTTGYTAWDGTSDLTLTTGNEIMVVEVDSSNKAKKAGKTTVTSK